MNLTAGAIISFDFPDCTYYEMHMPLSPSGEDSISILLLSIDAEDGSKWSRSSHPIHSCDAAVLCYSIATIESFVEMPTLLDTLTQMHWGSQRVVIVGTGRPTSDNHPPRQVEAVFGTKLANVFQVCFHEVDAVDPPRTTRDWKVCEIIRELIDKPISVVDESSAATDDSVDPYSGARLQLRQLKRGKPSRSGSRKKSHLNNSVGTSDSTVNGGGSRNGSMLLPRRSISANSTNNSNQFDFQEGTLVYPMPNLGLLSEENFEILMAGGEFQLVDFSADTLPRVPSMAPTELASPTHSIPHSVSSMTSNTLKHLSSSTTTSNIIAPIVASINANGGTGRSRMHPRIAPHIMSPERGKRMDVVPDDSSDSMVVEDYRNPNGTLLSRNVSTLVHRSDSTKTNGTTYTHDQSRRNSEASNNSQATTGTVISGFTIEELVFRLTAPDSHDMEFTKAFLMFYRKFMRPSELLDRLMDRFDEYDNRDPAKHHAGFVIPAVQLRVCNVLLHWLTDYWCDFHTVKMRFTLHVFLQICAPRPNFSEIVHRLGPLVFREPTSEEELKLMDWGVPDPAEDDDERPLESDRAEPPKVPESTDKVASPPLRRSGDDGAVPRNSVSDAWSFFGENGHDEQQPGTPIGRKMSGAATTSEDEFGGLQRPVSNAASSNGTVDRRMSGSDKEEDESNFGSTLVGGVGPGVFQQSKTGKSWRPNITNMLGSVNGSLSRQQQSSSAGNGMPKMLTVPLSVANSTSYLHTPFLDLDNYVIANQLNLMEFEIFTNIKPRDFLQHIWSRKRSQTVTASIEHFNKLSGWVITRILTNKKLKNRAKMLEKFMKIAQILRDSNNYNSLMAIMAGINSLVIFRLKQTRRLIENTPAYRQYESLQELMGTESGFGRYRAALKASEMPCIPYLGVFLRDLVYSHEAYKDRKPDGTINLPKFLLLGDLIMMMKSFQVRPYNITKEPYIRALIVDQPLMDEDIAYQRSIELEPKIRDAREE
ncbi:ras guanine nucleotide exchange factor domain-containing protein [Cladochytrium replicatum]|nr:ras guanine nucleotide exchange factor domain-containing protein [Cladochytrium replicatum]